VSTGSGLDNPKESALDMGSAAAKPELGLTQGVRETILWLKLVLISGELSCCLSGVVVGHGSEEVLEYTPGLHS